MAAGLGVGFAVPFVFADLLRLPRDLYYAVHIAAVLLFFALWARASGRRIDLLVRRRLGSAVVLGLGVEFVLGLVVVRTEPATSGPEGAALAWAGPVGRAGDR